MRKSSSGSLSILGRPGMNASPRPPMTSSDGYGTLHLRASICTVAKTARRAMMSSSSRTDGYEWLRGLSGLWTKDVTTEIFGPWEPGRRCNPFLAREPEGRFYQEHVGGRLAKDLANITREAKIPDRCDSVALLLPDEEDRRTGPVLPSQHGIALKTSNVEVRVAQLERWRRTACIWIESINAIRSARDRGSACTTLGAVHAIQSGPWREELLEARELSRGDEWLCV